MNKRFFNRASIGSIFACENCFAHIFLEDTEKIWVTITDLTMTNNKYSDVEEGEFLGFEPDEVAIALKRPLRGSLRVKQMGSLFDNNRAASLSAYKIFQLARHRLLHDVCQIKECDHAVEYSGVIIYEPTEI